MHTRLDSQYYKADTVLKNIFMRAELNEKTGCKKHMTLKK